jgi:hypothetical protein
MKKNFAVIFLCFLAGLAGGNISPILTGSGYIKFPETSPSASLSASGGQLTVAAGGTTKSILLMPSGGSVGVNTTDPSIAGTLGYYPGLTVVNSSTPLLAAYSSMVPNFALNVGSDGSWVMFDHAAGVWNAAVLSANGRVGIGVAANVSYGLNVAGDTNTGTAYRVAGTAGLGVVKTIRNSAGTGTCTMTFTGGILTASTC